jgi:antirestriction protein ArdC
MSAEGQDKIYTMITDKIMDALKNGTVPWRKPWTAGGWLPVSMSSRKPYRGVNIWLLAMEAAERGYDSPFWGTFKHIAELGGQVRKGEKSSIVVFWKRIMVDDKNAPDGKKALFMLRYYRVFNACQADGLPDRFYPAKDSPDKPVEVLDDAEAIVKGYLSGDGPRLVKVVGNRAFYTPATDTITLPEDGQFSSAGGRYSTVFHECAHSTGHASRLSRPGLTDFDHFGSGQYAQEELVAEMTASYLAGVCGIDTELDQSAAYIASWLTKLANDHKMVIRAAAQAQHAADLIRGISHTNNES